MGTQLLWVMAMLAGEECSCQDLVIGAAGGPQESSDNLYFL